MRRLTAIACLCLCLFGCMHSKNLDEYAYVLNVGVERGTTMPYLVTLLVSVPGTGSEQTEVKNIVLSAEARTLTEALETLNAAYPSRLSLSRASLLLLGEDLVRDGAQTVFLDFSFGKTDLWQNLRVAVASGSVAETMEGWLSETDPSLRKIKTSVGELQKRSGLLSDVGYSEYLECVSDPRIDALLMYAGKTDWTLEPDMAGGDAYPYLGGALLVSGALETAAAGSAVFDGDRMVGTLDGQHTMTVLMVRDTFESGELLCALPDGQPLAVRLYRVRRPNVTLYGNAAQVTVYLEADVTEPESVSMTSEELSDWIVSVLEERMRRTFSALQAANSDAMGFGRFAVRRFHSTAAWEAYDWKAAYRTLSVSFCVRLKLAHNPREQILE